MQKTFLLCIAFCIAALFACNEPDTVGLEVQPAGDAVGVNFVDTSTIITVTQKQDTIRSDKGYASKKSILLGSMNDNVFGTTTVSLYTQIKPATTGTQDFSKSRFDSLVLTLEYKDFYGDTTTQQIFEIYEVTEDLVDTSYYSNKTFTTSPTILATDTFLPQHRTDSISIGGTKFAPHIRIKLDSAFGKRVFDNFNTITDNLKGLHIKAKPVTGPGGIITFNIASGAITGMSLYYIKDITAGTFETGTATFKISTDPGFVFSSNFTRDFTLSPIVFDNETAGADKCYIQGMAGTKTKITFPYLKNFVSDLPKAINKAELVITVDPGSNSTLAVGERFGLAVINSDGTISNIPDDTQSAAWFGGTLYNGNQYRFNIAQYVQQVLTGKRTDYGLSLFAAEYTQYPNRTIIAGGGNGNTTIKMKLQLTFTNLNP